ncbi:hypothetical protein PanWU01x14_094970 [Parasponia andersonii]|uniref:Uncharacterized protein n=1 Tax=Parasponia andersonii TaxID=3476 RepID=A0A2P5D5J3_PARAD|nr:hypothetical protein PanWU01x14_094970 [Parasponia andersonii]
MEDPSMSYVIDAIHRIGAEYRGLKEQLRGVRGEIKLHFQDNKRRDAKRTRFQNGVFDIILRSRNSSNIGSQSLPENCSTEHVDFNNNEARVCESESLSYGSEKKESSPSCGRGTFKTEDGDAGSKSLGKRPLD